MLRYALTVISIWLCCSGFAVAAEPFSLSENQQSYLNDLQKRASAKQLASSAQWRALMHYHDRLLTNESTIDSAAFFLSPDGKKDLGKELDATLRAFFTPMDKVPAIEGKDASYNHPQCLFPARFDWLNEQLGFDEKRLPRIACKDWQTFKSALNTQRVAVIFTSAYMGNPASLFGHTLLRLDSHEETPLLSHALNYGAITGTDGGISFIFKGIFGGYNGIFSVSPYYDTVNQYNNMENRDIWEYRLNLPQKQVDTLVAHIWELGHNSAKYFFFSENCSYMLLETLNAALPEQDLTEPFYHPAGWNYTIPIDTARSVLKQKGLLKEAIFRPSRQSRLRHAYALLSDEEKEQLHKLLHAPRDIDAVLNSSLTDEQKAGVLVTAYEYVQYAFIAEDIPLDEMRRDSIRLLTPLSKLKDKKDITDVPVPVRPDLGHQSATTGVFGGRKDGKNFVDVLFRPAYHTMLDATAGYVPFGAINYMETTLRWYENENELRLNRFAFVDISSFAPRNAMFKPKSFKLNVGFESWQAPTKAKEGYVFYADFAGGFSWNVTDKAVFYIMPALHGKAGGYLHANSFGGAGLQTGFVADLGAVRLTGEIERAAFTDSDVNQWRYQAAAGVSLTDNLGMEASFDFTDMHRSDKHEARLGLTYHF